MSARPCPTCGALVERGWQGRPAVYCGTPCRQAAHRARQAAARAAEYARYLRDELASAEPGLHQTAIDALAALSRIHDYPMPGERDVPGGWEEDVMKHADAARRAWSMLFDIARAHSRARADTDAARIRSGEASAPGVGDETAAGSVARSPAAAAAT